MREKLYDYKKLLRRSRVSSLVLITVLQEALLQIIRPVRDTRSLLAAVCALEKNGDVMADPQLQYGSATRDHAVCFHRWPD